MPYYTRLKGVTDFNKESVRRTIELNLIDYFVWALLEAGAFVNQAVPSPGSRSPYGIGDLFPAQAQGVTPGTVWQGRHTDWCYESGLESGNDPVVASGVYVNGAFHPTSSTTGTYAHRLDFPRGRVVFDSPLPLTSVVQADYAYKTVSLYDQSVPWFRPVVLDAFLTQQDEAAAGGVLGVLNDYRVTTPLVVVEAVMRQRLTPYQLGNLSHHVHQDVLFHVLTEDKDTRDRVADAVSLQKDATVLLYDVNARTAAGDFPLDWRGSPAAGASAYPDLLTRYPLSTAYFEETSGGDDSVRLPLFRGTVRATVSTVFTSF